MRGTHEGACRMSARDPLPDEHVPDVVLEELLAAFGTPSPDDAVAGGDVAYDFDDPSIDRLLGIDTEEVNRRAAAADVADAAAAAQPAAAGEPPTGAPPRRVPASRRERRAERRADPTGAGRTTPATGETTTGVRVGAAAASAAP